MGFLGIFLEVNFYKNLGVFSMDFLLSWFDAAVF